MSIDWSATGDMLSGIGTISGTIAVVAAAFLGRQAVTDYRRQKQIEREIEHAEQALAASYKLQSAMSSIRSPLTTGQESAESRGELEETDWFDNLTGPEQSRYIQANVFYRRIRHFQADFDAAISVLPFVKAYFGEIADAALRDLIQCRHAVRVYADAYSKDQGHDAQHTQTIHAMIWEGFGMDEDPIQTRIRNGLLVLESELLPAIRSTARTSKPIVSVSEAQ